MNSSPKAILLIVAIPAFYLLGYGALLQTYKPQSALMGMVLPGTIEITGRGKPYESRLFKIFRPAMKAHSRLTGKMIYLRALPFA